MTLSRRVEMRTILEETRRSSRGSSEARGQRRVLSGAQLALRLNSARFGLSSFFLDNWLAALLETEPGTVFSALHKRVGGSESDLRHSLEELAGSVVSVKRENTT